MHSSSLNESGRLGEIIEAVKALEVAIKRDTNEELAGKAPPYLGVLSLASCPFTATPHTHSGHEMLHPSTPVLHKVSKLWCASIREHPRLFVCICVGCPIFFGQMLL